MISRSPLIYLASLTLCATRVVSAPLGDFQPQADALTETLATKLGIDPVPSVSFEKDPALPTEGYSITFGKTAISVKASTSAGAAYAAATILRRPSHDGSEQEASITESPDHAYRSFMVDMGRNPHSPETLRHVVDMMWIYKANYLHLHLTDDQLISWPSKAFPKIYSKNAGWTWEDFEALEAYSQARGVTIIPEIDVPGHSNLLRKHYPEVFGKSPTDLATSPKAQKGVETILEEFLSVFKATPYLHVGGDEAFGVPQNDQRDFINRLNKFVKSKGKRTVVWEGPHLGKGENKVDTDVLHINWRTIEFPAQQMLDAGYQVINAAWDPLYIVDHYPKTMFTAVDIERCYHWDITRFAHINHDISTFEKPFFVDSAENILGFCMPWWEGREKNIMPLCLERFAAVATAAWDRKAENNFADYQERQKHTLAVFQKVSGYTIPPLPLADPETQKENVAYLAEVAVSAGASQPHFGPQRLTNGIPDRFDHFLGFPTKPKRLEITVKLPAKPQVGRIVVHEAAVRQSHEVYEILVTTDGGQNYQSIGESKKGTRGENTFVEFTFEPREINAIMIRTQGCEDLTFPSFSRLTEITAFAK